MSLPMVTRAEWGAMPPCHQDPLSPPVIDVSLVHAVSLTCHDKEECSKLMRFLQRCSMGKHQMADIKHNFYISRDGTIYEGRGWLANTMNYDLAYDEDELTRRKGKFITIARLGLNFEGLTEYAALIFVDDPATPEELAAKEAIIRYGVEQKYISPDYKDEEGDYFLHFGNSNPPDNLPFEPWKPPPCSEKEKTILYNCTTESGWEVGQYEWLKPLEN